MSKENNVIVLEQKPIITYDLVEAKGKEVAERIASLNLAEIEPTEENLKVLKSTRTELSKEFKVFEEQRKMVKELIMKPYNDFDDAYKKHISSLFQDADAQLKKKVDAVDDAILNEKIAGIRAYFEDANAHEFLQFDDIGIKIIKSRSDKSIKDEIDEYLSMVQKDIETIKTLDNSDRVLAKYELCKNMGDAISQTNIEIQREKDIAERKAAQEEQRIALEAQRAAKMEQMQAQEAEQEEEQKVVQKEPEPEDKIYRASFSVTGTAAQLRELKKYMDEKGLNYESK